MHCTPWYDKTPLSITAFFNITTDFVRKLPFRTFDQAPANDSLDPVFAPPLLVIRSYKLQRSERYAFAFIYVIGGLSPLASVLRYTCIRMGYVYNPAALVKGVEVNFGADTVTLDEMIKFWTTLECTTGIIAFCLPSLRRVFHLNAVKLQSRRAVPVPAQGTVDDSYVSAYSEANTGSDVGILPRE